MANTTWQSTEFPFEYSSAGVPTYSFLRNKIINGGMAIDQRNQGASITPINLQYSVDRWQAGVSAASKFSLQQTSIAAGLGPYAGFGLTATSLSAYAVAAGDAFTVQQAIEGNNIGDLGFGTANATSVTVSFWAIASFAGNYGASVRNYANTRSYPFLYSIPVANTLTYITVTIPGDTAGTWVQSGAAGGLYLTFGLGVGTAFSGPPGVWASANYVSATGAFSLVGTNAATLTITDVQFETGTQATPFEYRLFGAELMLCRRYCFAINPGVTSAPFYPAYCQAATTVFGVIGFPEVMRATPSYTFVGTVANLQFNALSAYTIQAAPVFQFVSVYGALMEHGVIGCTAGIAGSVLSTTTAAQMIWSAEL